MRRTLAATGWLLMSAGALLALFVVYQLWGTGLSESHAQSTLKSQFRAERAQVQHSSAPPATVLPGYALGIIQIPRIGLEKFVVQGTGEADLQKGPGHYPNSPLPGQPGNVAIAGHRTTYGAPFYNLNELQAGDPIRLTVADGTTYTYDVTGQQVVSPSDVAVVAPTPDDRLTLTTCNPRFSASTRLVVTAKLVGSAAPVAASTPTPAPAPRSVLPASPGENTGSALPPIVGYGGGALLLAAAALLLRRRAGWLVLVPALPAFLVLLFFCFENVSRILPPGY